MFRSTSTSLRNAGNNLRRFSTVAPKHDVIPIARDSTPRTLKSDNPAFGRLFLSTHAAPNHEPNSKENFCRRFFKFSDRSQQRQPRSTMMEDKDTPSPVSSSYLRIACLMPSATQICLELGLANNIVGVTHECNTDEVLKARTNNDKTIFVLTRSGLDETFSQAQIHQAVLQDTCGRKQQQQEQQQQGGDADVLQPPSSLYPLIRETWDQAKANLVFTHDLCNVCSPTSKDIPRQNSSQQQLNVISLSPKTLSQVADTFISVAEACGVTPRGQAMKDAFWKDFETLRETILRNAAATLPRMMVLEWLDPPFDAGHWVLDLMKYVCIEPATSSSSEKDEDTTKSQQITWDIVQQARPDTIMVACPGMTLERNIQDAHLARAKFQALDGKPIIFASYGDAYLVQPSPYLIQGARILAQCAYHDQPAVLDAISKLDFVSSFHDIG